MKILVYFMTLALAGCAISEEEVLNVFVLTGQSNSLGIIKDGEPLQVRNDDNDKNIKFFWVDRDPQAEIVSTSQGKISYLQIQKYDNGSNQGHFGLEISCFRDLYKTGMKDVMLIKASRGGGGNAFWSKESPDHHMYDAVLEAVKAATVELENQKIKYRIVGLLYLQGESDGQDAKIADQRAKRLLDNLRSDLPHASQMKMFIGGIGGPDSRSGLARKMHKQLADRHKDVTFIDTSDLLETGQYQDNLHFNNTSKEAIGLRFAQTIKKELSQ